MKERKIKREYIVLAVIIVALCLYLLLQKSDKVHYKIPKLESLKKDAIEKIEITKKDGKIVLVHQDEKWLIGEAKYPADDDRVDKITTAVSDLALTEMVSESKNYVRYGLDAEKRIAVKAYTKEGQPKREFEIGNPTATYGHTFVKIAGDPRVYQARESFRNHFDRKMDDLRDKKVMTFDKEEISEIEVFSEGNTYLFTKNVKTIEPEPKEKKEGEKEPKAEETAPPEPQQEISWLTNDGKTGDKSKLDSFINQLSNLSCDSFIEGKTAKDFGEPIFSIKMMGTKEYTFSIFKKEEKEGGKYPALSSENPYPFLISTYKAENFTRDAKELIPEEKPKKDES